ncbi:hypothetical protein [Bradyrhizobium ottawaense]|uniref:Uncharacterized protein n=1 Tax=Bradyrhizobium ottawaense TaxID=931866 RepID=A0ABY0QHL6_9BRAD|nr:hypothetical protein [Bradyrhizobium ottawaense]SDK45752.1 hypothetical protein SAMN05444163_8159 [Bradyrhizobium ottawaense]
MTIALKLDAGAIDKLFSDQDSKVELQQAVVAEICRRLFTNYINKDVLKVVEAVFGGEANSLIEMIKENETFKKRFEKAFEETLVKVKKEAWSRDTYTLKPEAKKKLEDAVQTQVDSLLKQHALRGEQLVNETVERIFGAFETQAMDVIDRKLTAKVNALFDGGISEMVESRVAKALKVAKA